MSFTVNLQQRLQQLKKLQTDLRGIMEEVSRNATIDAIAAAQDATPPKAGRGVGAPGENTLTGDLKDHWEKDSITEPMGGALSGGASYTTVLGNNLEYASYVNDGHRMDRHFVPGLYIDPITKHLVYDEEKRDVGIMVGTKTRYVKGEFMAEKGKEAYEKSVLAQLDGKIRGLMG